MITLKTTTKFSVPFGRTCRTEFIYLTIERLEIDINNVTPIGYYYFIDENEQIQKLDDVSRVPMLWEQINLAETGEMFPVLNNNIHLKNNLIQRLIEFTMYKLEQEENTNYGTLASDFVII